MKNYVRYMYLHDDILCSSILDVETDEPVKRVKIACRLEDMYLDFILLELAEVLEVVQ